MHRRVGPAPRIAARAGIVATAILFLAFGAPLGLTPASSVLAENPEAIVLEIASSISITRLNDATVDGGMTTAFGWIRLTPGPTPDLWRGSGDLSSSTSSGPAACSGGHPGMHLEGSGMYNWVAEVRVEPGIEPSQIYAAIDARDPIEEPDVAILDYCTGTNTAMYNTWENLFFSVHQADYRANGMFVAPWTLLATGSSWVDGELIATAEWHGDCELASALLSSSCSETTKFRLTADSTASPTAVPTAAPTAGQLNPGGSAEPSVVPVTTPASSLDPAPSPTTAVATPTAGNNCGDLAGCVAANWPIAAAGLALLALLTLLGWKVRKPSVKASDPS